MRPRGPNRNAQKPNAAAARGLPKGRGVLWAQVITLDGFENRNSRR